MSEAAPPKRATSGHWIPKDQQPPKKRAKAALFPGVNKRTQKLNKHGSETKEKILAKFQKQTSTRTSPKGHMLWAHETFDPEQMARRFRFGEQPSVALVTEARMKAVMNKSPQVLGWKVSSQKDRRKSALNVSVRYNALHQSGAPYEDMVPLWSLWELVAFGKAVKKTGTKRTARIPHAAELCARCPAFWWSLALWAFSEVTRTADKATWNRLPTAATAAAKGESDDESTDKDNEADAEAPRAALNQLQVVPAEEDDDLPEPSEPSEHWPPQCPKGRAVSIPGPFETLIGTFFQGCWEDLSERTIQTRMATVLGVKPGPLPKTYHVLREESMTEEMKESEARHRAQMKEFRGEVLAENKKAYQQRQALESIKKTLADLPENLQQQVVDQLQPQRKRKRDPLEDEIFGRSDDENAEESVPKDEAPEAAKERNEEKQKDTEEKKPMEKKKPAEDKAPEVAKQRVKEKQKDTEEKKLIKKKKSAEDKAPEAAKERIKEKQKDTEEKKKPSEDKAPEAAKERNEEKQKDTKEKKKPSEDKVPEAAKEMNEEKQKDTEEPKPMKKKKPPQDKAQDAAKERNEEKQNDTEQRKPMKKKKPPEDKAPEATKERNEEKQKDTEEKKKPPEDKATEAAKERIQEKQNDTEESKPMKKKKPLEDKGPEVAKERNEEKQKDTEEPNTLKKRKPREDKAPEAGKERNEEKQISKGKDSAETEEPKPMKKKKSLEDKASEAAKERNKEKQMNKGKDSAETEESKPMKKKKSLEDKAAEVAKERNEEKQKDTEEPNTLKKRKPREDTAPEAGKERNEERQISKGKDSSETGEPKPRRKKRSLEDNRLIFKRLRPGPAEAVEI